MRESYLVLGLAVCLTVLPSLGGHGGQALAADNDPSRQELVNEIQQLRELVNTLNDRLTQAENMLKDSDTGTVDEKFADVEDTLDELDDRVSANERHSVMDRVNLSVDLKTEVTSLHYSDARVLEDWNQSMLSLWAFDQLAVPFNTNDVTGDGLTDYTFNSEFMQAYGSSLAPIMPDMFMNEFFSGFYLPSGAAAFDLPAGSYVSSTDAAAMMANVGMDPTNATDVANFLVTFTQAAPDAQAVLASSSAGGTPLFGSSFTAADMAKYQGMFKTIKPQPQDIDNDAIITSRVRFDVRATPTPHLSFGGRLTANKVWGDSTGVKWFTGDFSSVAMDGNVHQKGSDSALRLERGFFTYRDDWDGVHWHFSLGRRPALGGAPWEFSEHSVLGGSPMAHAINWQFDGASLGFDLSEKVGIDGFNFKLCYGQGFESGAGSGNSYSMSYSNDVDDTSFLGYIWRLYDDGTTKVVNMYAHAFDVTDGFTGLVAMPFSVSALDIDGDDLYDYYEIGANNGGYISRMEAFSNIGDMDLLTVLIQSNYKGVEWFIDFAMNHTDPDGVSQNPMMQFWGSDSMMNSNGKQESHSGYSIWAGIKFPIKATQGALGLEYNWGSKYWFGFNGGEDTLNASKLATRGSVYEVYYHQPLIGNKLLLTVGSQYYDYKYTGSGNPMGEPTRIDDATALHALMPIADKLWSAYANMSYRW